MSLMVTVGEPSSSCALMQTPKTTEATITGNMSLSAISLMIFFGVMFSNTPRRASMNLTSSTEEPYSSLAWIALASSSWTTLVMNGTPKALASMMATTVVDMYMPTKVKAILREPGSCRMCTIAMTIEMMTMGSTKHCKTCIHRLPGRARQSMYHSSRKSFAAKIAPMPPPTMTPYSTREAGAVRASTQGFPCFSCSTTAAIASERWSC
mmetsp:Transcript_78098/g.171193  ORF Transcript_78098/g.171193 Transcript_78098/m.171193 type:complete len:209 (+) Transcript_78098:435-1061(+)